MALEDSKYNFHGTFFNESHYSRPLLVKKSWRHHLQSILLCNMTKYE